MSLSYCPKHTSLLNKFGDLPLTYTRTNLNTLEEIEIFEEACRKWNFSLKDSENMVPHTFEQPAKRMRINPASVQQQSPASPSPELIPDDDDDYESQRF